MNEKSKNDSPAGEASPAFACSKIAYSIHETTMNLAMDALQRAVTQTVEYRPGDETAMAREAAETSQKNARLAMRYIKDAIPGFFNSPNRGLTGTATEDSK